MSSEPVTPMTEGRVFRVTLTHGDQFESYLGVYVRVDIGNGVVHIFSQDAQAHYLTIPLGHAIIEWQDPSALEPRPRTSPYGSKAFDAMEKQLETMTKAMSERFG
jgi:hypothetical protein